MASLVRHVTFDCADPHSLAVFWAEVVDGALGEGDVPGDPEIEVNSEGVSLLFIRVEEGKEVKNRVHLDLVPKDRTRDEEVERLVALGAKQFEDHRRPDGAGWVTLTDIEGNEFCVVRSAAERAATGTA
ncbi:VOC family protein [Kitasatospora purpeofusca]|uniref:VOC family protein n=1 Tax=Kitasatospora TaxID=2063 RepID=UPI0004C1B93A|nr:MULTISPECIES: VOC family protein [Kitasatospora]